MPSRRVPGTARSPITTSTQSATKMPTVHFSTPAWSRYPEHAPRDLWCGPYLDTAFNDTGPDGKRAKEIIRAYQKQGVEDAFKASKAEVSYGVGNDECCECKHYGGGKFNTCAIVCGLVRGDRQCDRYEEK